MVKRSQINEMSSPKITLLRKTSLQGKLYTRVKSIEAQLHELQALSREELVSRCSIQQRNDPHYVPSECLLYFVRACRAEQSEVHFEQLYRILAERVLRRLPSGESAYGDKLYLSDSLIRDKAFGRFVDMLALDRTSYCEQLDFYEIRFDSALRKLCIDAQRQIRRDEKGTEPLELDEETGEPSPEVEKAARNFDPFDAAEFDGEDYRSRLNAAINSLPAGQRAIIEMMRKGIPIDSKDPAAVTIAKTLGKSEKTIRTHRDKALASLRAALKREEDEP